MTKNENFGKHKISRLIQISNFSVFQFLHFQNSKILFFDFRLCCGSKLDVPWTSLLRNTIILFKNSGLKFFQIKSRTEILIEVK